MRRNQSALIAVLLFFTLMTVGLGQSQAQSYVFGSASFVAPTSTLSSPPAGSPPIIAVDLNGDGITDFAILGGISGTTGVSILMGRVDGTFAPMVNYPVTATGIAVGDFNGDGKLDIVTVSDEGFPVATILVGNGDGTFQSASPLNLGISNATYSSISAADLNGDGKLDVVLLARPFGATATMAVLLGHGDETFDAPVTYTVPNAPYLSFADLNGDGKPDIVVTGPGSKIAVLINNGNGTYQTPTQYSVSPSISSTVIADMNGDGKLDLVVSAGGQSTTINVLLGMGDGTFANPVTYSSNLLDIYGVSLAVADFNSDGKLDVAATSNTGYGVVILLGKGDGTFQASPPTYSAGKGGVLVALDVNGDGKPDLAAWGGGYQDFSSLAVIINQGNGTFPTASTYPVIKYPLLAVQGDFDGDGKLDIAVGTATVDSIGQYTGGIVSVLRGKGDGTFQPRQDTPSTTFPAVMASGDFSGDGKLDLVVVVEDTSFLTETLDTLIGNGDGTFQHTVGQSIPRTTSLALGDFNHDGKLDVATNSGSAEAFYIFLGRGDGTFAAPVIYSTGSQVNGSVTNIKAADFNGDGILDLAFTTRDGVSLVMGKADGTFGPFTLTVAGSSLLAVGNLNGDGRPDLVYETYPDLYGAVGNGNGTFQQGLTPFNMATTQFINPNIAGDFNGDGYLDMAFNDLNDGGISIVFGNGDGTFTRHIEYATNQVGAFIPGDFNGDGVLDLAMTDISYQTVNVLINSPVIAFYPNPLIFSTQLVGTASADKSVTVNNPSPVSALFSDAATLGDFSATNACGSKLVPGENCQANVTFTPTAAGNRLGSLIFTDSVPGSPQVISMIGKGTGPAAEFNPTALTFGTQGIGTSSAAKSVVLSNEGNTTLTVTSIAASGDFAQTNTCGTSLSAGATCSVNVFFHPTQVGIRTGTITVRDNAGDSPQTVALTGTGLGGTASLSPTSLTFSGQNLRTTSSAQAVTLSNTSAIALAIGSIAATGDFAQTNNCGNSLAASGSCTISVTFKPTASAARSGAITLTDNAASSPQTVSLDGTGEDFSLAPNSGASTSATVSAGQGATYTLSLGGESGLTGTVTFACTGAPAHATCTVSPNPLTVGSSPATATVTVTTTAATLAAPGSPHVPPMPPLPAHWQGILLLAAILAMAGWALAMGGRMALQPRRLRLLPLATGLALVIALAGCGGGGGGGGGPVGNPGTPSGTYTLTVTGTTGSGANALSHTIALTLKVS